MLLLAGIGVGAFMLFANKSGAQSKSLTVDATSGSGADEIPAAPKILAVNQSSTESPTPTGIVSDEEGMEATGAGESASSGDEGSDSDSAQNSSGSLVDMTVAAGTAAINRRQAQSDDIPPLISTTLTAKEKSIIDKGVLSDALAIQRPDLYKAIYIRKHGRNGNGQKALLAADALIQNIQVKGNSEATVTQKRKRKVAITLNPNSGNMVKVAAQTGGGFAAIAALNALNSMQYANSGKAPMKKPVRRIGSKGAHAHSKPVHHASATHHPVAKHPASRHKTSPHLKH